MNLGFDSWIPVTFADGTHRDVSLADIFRDGSRIADLAARPHERIALMRLLVCVAQAALDGPADEYGWDEAAKKLPDAAAAYLEKWRSCFELFGDGPRFLQAKTNQMSPFEDSSKLVFHRSSGNNETVFDNGGGPGRRLTESELALALLCNQNFCSNFSYGQGCKGLSPCIPDHFLQTWLIEKNLLETILANGVDRVTADGNFPGGFGRPTWEYDVDVTSERFLKNASLSFLGRLAPVTWLFWLNENRLQFEIFKKGISHPKFEEFRDSAATVHVRKMKGEEKRILLEADLLKHPWRDLQHVVQARQGKTGGPLPLQRSEPALFKRLWLGALVTDGRGKYKDTVEAIYDLPRELLSEQTQSIYAGGVEFATAWSKRLWAAVTGYAGTLKIKPDGARARAERHFWTALDQRLPDLMDVVRNVGLMGGKMFWEADVPWTRSVRRAARDAYEHACPRETPRQIQAFALGLKKLRPPKPTKEQNEKPIQRI